MVDGIFSHANYQGLKKMLDVSVLRQEAIASNLANLETPNYKRIDVETSFGAELSRAVNAKKVEGIQKLHPRLVVDPTAPAPNRDGNTVQLDSELMHLQQNGMAHTMQTQMITGALRKIRSAIQGRIA